MKAAQYIERGKVLLCDVSTPQIGVGDVLVRMKHVAICGSDLQVLYDSPVDSFPFAPGVSGHECVGIVEQSNALAFKPGDRVLVIPPTGVAWAEYLTIAPYWVIPIPDHLTMAKGLMAQILGCVIYACKKLGNVLDKTVVVVGQGPAGILFSTLLHQMGAKKVIGLDMNEHCLKIASEMGADYIVDVSQRDPIEVVSELTEGQMADIVVEVVGKAETVNLSVDLVRAFGELILFGIPKQPTMMFEIKKFLRKQLHTTTIAFVQREPQLSSFRLAMDFIASGRIDVTPVISHHIPFKNIQHAFELAHTKKDGAVKVIVDIVD